MDEFTGRYKYKNLGKKILLSKIPVDLWLSTWANQRINAGIVSFRKFISLKSIVHVHYFFKIPIDEQSKVVAVPNFRKLRNIE